MRYAENHDVTYSFHTGLRTVTGFRPVTCPLSHPTDNGQVRTYQVLTNLKQGTGIGRTAATGQGRDDGPPGWNLPLDGGWFLLAYSNAEIKGVAFAPVRLVRPLNRPHTVNAASGGRR